MHTFYNVFNRRGYYNSFLRVKEELLEKSIIKIEKIMKKKTIRLTEKGYALKSLMIEMAKMVDGELFGRGREETE